MWAFCLDRTEGHRDLGTEGKRVGFYLDRQTDGWMDRQTDRQTDGWTDGRTDKWSKGFTDGGTEGQTEGQIQHLLKRKEIENHFKLTSIAMRWTTDRHYRTDIVRQDWMHTYYIVVDISSLFCLFLRKGGSLCLYVHMFVCLSIRHSVGPAR